MDAFVAKYEESIRGVLSCFEAHPHVRPAWRKCLHLDCYFLDRQLGLIHVKVLASALEVRRYCCTSSGTHTDCILRAPASWCAPCQTAKATWVRRPGAMPVGSGRLPSCAHAAETRIRRPQSGMSGYAATARALTVTECHGTTNQPRRRRFNGWVAAPPAGRPAIDGGGRESNLAA